MIGKILTYFIFGFMCIVGGGSSIFVVLGIPVMIIWKLLWALRHHENPLN